MRKAFLIIALLVMLAAASGLVLASIDGIYALKIGDKILVELDEGQRLAILLLADPEVRCIALPEGAVYDDVRQVLTWIPDFDQKGAHVIVFSGQLNGEDKTTYVLISVHNVNWAPEADLAYARPSSIWPNDEMVPVDIVLQDPLSRKMEVTINKVEVVDTIVNSRSVEQKAIKDEDGDGMIRRTSIEFTQRIFEGKEGVDYRVEEGMLYLLASKPVTATERHYKVNFTLTHPITRLSDSGEVIIRVTEGMHEILPFR